MDQFSLLGYDKLASMGRGTGAALWERAEMLFNTEDFARFFAVVFALYWVLRKHLRAQNVLLLASAYYFYACWEPRFLVLLIASTVMDYACGIAVDRIEDSRKRKAFVALSMVLNLGMLGYFKYYNFFAESLQSLTIRLGVPVQLSTLKVVLPIGISFYTFQSMSYVIDVYRRETDLYRAGKERLRESRQKTMNGGGDLRCLCSRQQYV